MSPIYMTNNKINFTIIFFLLGIIIFSLYFADTWHGMTHKYRVEGFVDYMNPNTDQIKNIREIPSTQLLTILSEIYTNVDNHEKLLSILNEDYKYEAVSQNTDYSMEENIFSLFRFLKKHDNELVRITEDDNQYIPSDVLDRLIDGSLMKPLRDDLYKIKNYPGKSMMPYKETDPDVMKQQGQQYIKKANEVHNSNLRGDVKKEVVSKLLKKADKKYVDATKKEIEDDPHDNANTPVDTDPRITQRELETKLIMNSLYYVKGIVEYQETAIQEIQKKVTTSIIQNYSNL